MGNVKTTKGTIFFKVVVMPIPMPPDVCHAYISSQLSDQPFTTLVHSAPSAASFIDFYVGVFRRTCRLDGWPWSQYFRA